MVIIHRERPLKRLVDMMHNGRIKIVTGIRRCGKSFLLSHLFKEHLHQQGVKDSQIIEISLDKKQHEAMRNPNVLYQYVVEKIEGQNKQFYLFIDEIQLSYRSSTRIWTRPRCLKKTGNCFTPPSMISSTI